MKIPTQLQDEKFRFIKLRTNGKTPIEKDWGKTNNYSHVDIKGHSGNVGILGGVGGLYILDFDSAYAYNQVKALLPKTFTVLSAGKRLPHLYYYDSRSTITSAAFDLKNGNRALDVIGTGKQAVAPYSRVKNNLYIEGMEDISKYAYYNVKEDVPIVHLSQKAAYSLLKAVFSEAGVTERGKKDGHTINLNGSKRVFERNDRVNTIKRKWSVSKFFRFMGSTKNGRMWDTPFGHSIKKKCVDIDDNKGVYFDFNTYHGGDVITAAKMYWNCNFKEALDKLEKE